MHDPCTIRFTLLIMLHRLTIETISRSISTKVWDQAGIELTTPVSAAGLTTNCGTGPGSELLNIITFIQGYIYMYSCLFQVCWLSVWFLLCNSSTLSCVHEDSPQQRNSYKTHHSHSQCIYSVWTGKLYSTVSIIRTF